MSQSRVKIEYKDAIAIVTLTRADKCNALDMDMFYQIDRSIKTLSRNRDIRAVILRGDGSDFCTGLDVKSIMTNKISAIKLIWKWNPWSANLAQRVSAGWRSLRVPVIAAIHGRCWGGGLQIAFGCDFRIASSSASLSIMEARWGLIPDMAGTLAMRETMPIDIGMKLAMIGDEFSAEDGLKWGVLTKVDDDPLEAAMNLARQIREKSPDTVAAIKRLFHRAWHRDDLTVLARETWLQWGVLLGKNREIAVRRALGKPAEFLPRPR